MRQDIQNSYDLKLKSLITRYFTIIIINILNLNYASLSSLL